MRRIVGAQEVPLIIGQAERPSRADRRRTVYCLPAPRRGISRRSPPFLPPGPFCGEEGSLAFRPGQAAITIDDMLPTFPDEPPVRAQECPLCGGEVEIGLAGMLSIGNGPEHWSESGHCMECGAALTRELADTEKPVVLMTRLDWRLSS